VTGGTLAQADNSPLSDRLRPTKLNCRAHCGGASRKGFYTMTDLSEIKGLVENVGTKLNNDAAALKSRLDSLERHIARVQVNGGGGFKASGGDNAEIKAAFVQAMRTGQSVAAVDEKGMRISEGPQGGFTVPSEIDRIIQNQLRDISPIRQIAQVVMTNSSDFKPGFNRSLRVESPQVRQQIEISGWKCLGQPRHFNGLGCGRR
jgi:hypothetical protein